MKKLIVFMLAIHLASCSMSGSNKEAKAFKSDDLEFAVDTFMDTSRGEEFQVEEESIASIEPSFSDFQQDFHTANMPNDNDPIAMHVAEAPVRAVIEHMGEKTPIVDPYSDTFADTSTEAPVIAAKPTESTYAAEMDSYIVQKGDTLMMVAFKIYGDYGKWKKIKEWNPGMQSLHAGMSIKYKVPEREFGWAPEGHPYLIKRGDTLQTISLDVYQTTKKWRRLYEQNKPLIKNPNLIFAGFTIFYNSDRQLASEKE